MPDAAASKEPSHAELGRRLDGITEQLNDFDSDEREMHGEVVRHGEVLGRLDRAVFGTGYGDGLVVEVQRMTVKIGVATWVFGILGSATLVTLVGIFFQNVSRGA